MFMKHHNEETGIREDISSRTKDLTRNETGVSYNICDTHERTVNPARILVS